MYIRKLGRLNSILKPDFHCEPGNQGFNPNFLRCHGEDGQRQPKLELQPQEFKGMRYFNSPQIEDLAAQESKEATSKLEGNDEQNNMKKELHNKNASATTKALNQMEINGEKRKFKKGEKISTAVRRKKLNQRLSRVLVPKNALILLHDLKPDCVYNVQEEMGSNPPMFFAEVGLDGEILGSGRGPSKSQAKNLAAEAAIREIVSKSMSRWTEAKEVAHLHTQPDEETTDSQEADDEDDPENLPWVGLASFAIYKMFSEWQNQGTNLPPRPILKKKLKTTANAPTKKDLPPNAAELHPAVVLNMVNPGLTAIELERDDTPKCRVKMAYVIEGKMFSGVGGNKKDAKKEAAKAVLEGLYGLTYR